MATTRNAETPPNFVPKTLQKWPGKVPNVASETLEKMPAFVIASETLEKNCLPLW